MGAGFETECGDIITPALEVEYSRIDTEKSHLSVVKPTAPDPVILPSPPTTPAVIDDDEGWADPPAPKSEQITDSAAQEIIALLEGRNIPYDLDLECGYISAKSFAHKELLKSSGFKWSPEVKAWMFHFETEPDPF